MGFFSFIGQTATAAGKSFKHIIRSAAKGLSDPFKLVKNTTHALTGITKPAAKVISVVNKGIRFAKTVPGIGEAIDVADLAVLSATGISPVTGLLLAEEGLNLFNKVEGKLNQSNSAEQFLSQNRGDIKKLLKNPNLRAKALHLLKRLV